MPETTNMARHTDGSLWVACTADSPQRGRTVEIGGEVARVYHPDARVMGTSYDGADEYFECPHCMVSWWVEYDG